MSPLPLVSVITPTVACGPLISRTIASVRRQDYPRLEHVIVGDALRGPARRRLDGLVAGPTHRVTLRVLNSPEPAPEVASYRPARAAHARTAGLGAASGDLVAFLDDDNEYEPDHITAMVRHLLARPPLQAVYCWRQLLNADGSDYLTQANPWEGDPEQARRDYDTLVAARVWVPGTNLLRDRLDANTVDASCWLMHPELLTRVPFRLLYSGADRAVRLGEDVAFCFDIKRHGIQVGCVENYSVRYYLGGFSTSGARQYEVSA